MKVHLVKAHMEQTWCRRDVTGDLAVSAIPEVADCSSCLKAYKAAIRYSPTIESEQRNRFHREMAAKQES